MTRIIRLWHRCGRSLRFDQWPGVLKLALGPGAIMILVTVTIAITLGALSFAQRANNTIVERDMQVVMTLSSIVARFDHADADLQRLLVDTAARGAPVDVDGRTQAIKQALGGVRRDLLSIRPFLTQQDRSRINHVIGEFDRYAEAIDVVSMMLDVDFRASVAMLTPFRRHADGVIADVDRMSRAGIAEARRHADKAADRTRMLVWLVSAAMLIVALLSSAWLAMATYRGRQLRKEIGLREQAEASALRLARHDPLTALVNRRAFVDAIVAATSAPAPRPPFAIALIDLDGFKDTNDLHGHAAGDVILRTVADRLRAALPADSVVARLGGDEFAVMSFTADPDALRAQLERLSVELQETLQWQGVLLRFGASMGVALFPQDGQAPDTLLHAADIAMYEAKRLGKGIFRFFEAKLEAKRVERRRLEAELRAGIEGGQVVPFYQPFVHLDDGRIGGFEILARWQHPRLGLLEPSAFIRLAEETGQAAALTESLLARSCRDIAALPTHLRFAINISPIQLAAAGVADRLIDIVRRARLDPCRFEVELTEDAIMDENEVAGAEIARFRASGMSIAIDDFGTGFSCLSNLRRARFDKIKIDRSFVSSMLASEESRKLVEAIIGLATRFDMQITAEGIEDRPTAHLLAQIGCHHGQGYLYSHPLPFAEVTALLTGRRAA